MNKKTKRIIIIVGIIIVLLLALFGRLDDVLNLFLDTEGTSAQTSLDAAPVDLDTVAPETNTYTTENSSYSGPVLPTDNLADKDLFEDGYAIVKLDFSIDGDTAAFIVNGKSYHVRMLAIDTPEVDANLRQVDPWGKTASNYTKNALEHADQIVLELDPDSDIFDKYGRLLAWVWVDGKLHNFNIVEKGLAKVAYLYGNYLYTYEVQDAESTAKSNGLKIWGEKDPDYDY